MTAATALAGLVISVTCALALWRLFRASSRG